MAEPAGDPPLSRAHGAGLLLAFTVSGATALVFEQVAEKLIGTLVGARAAPGLVVAVFFLGLAAGSRIGARASLSAGRPLALFGTCAGICGAWALGVGLFFPELSRASAAVAEAFGSSPQSLFAGRLVVTLLWLLVPAAASGATLPAMAAEIERSGSGGGAAIARFYACNLLGAAAAAAAAAYGLFPAIGLTKSAVVAGVLDGALALAAFWLAGGGGPAPRPAVPASGVPGPLYALAFLSGFVLLGLEVIWVHLTGAVLGGSAYAFGAMLAAVLLALFAGGLAVARIPAHHQASPYLAVGALLWGAAMLALSFAGWDRAPGALAKLGAGIASFAPAELLRFGLALALIGPPAVLLGALTPLTFRLAGFPAAGTPGAAGRLVAANSAGCVLGALVTGFVLLPALGSSPTARALAGALVAAAAALAFSRQARHRVPAPLGLAAAVLAAVVGLTFWPRWNVLALTSGLHVSFRPASVGPGSRLLFLHEDLAGGMTTVIENPPREPGDPPVHMVLTDGKFQGGDGRNQAAQVLLGLLPVVHRSETPSAFVIGLGTGQSAEVLAASGAERVVVAEIAPGIREAARRFFGPLQGDLFRRPGVAILLEDGRNLLQRSPETFAVIATQVNSAWFAGAGSLYSQEFYELARRRMTDRGVFEQWVPLHHIAPEDVASAVATLQSVFPHVLLYRFADQGYLLASAAPLALDAAVLERLSRESSLARHLTALEGRDGRPLAEIGRFLLLDEAAASRLSRAAMRRGGVLSTDVNRHIEYAAARGAVAPSGQTPHIVESLLALAAAD